MLVAAFQAPLSFVNAGRFGQDFRAMVSERAGSLKHVVFEASSVIDIDYTAAQTLRDIIAYCRGAGITFSIARLESVRAQKALRRYGITAMLGQAGVYRSVDDAVRALTSGRDAAAATPAASGKESAGLSAAFDSIAMREAYYLKARMSQRVDCPKC